MTGDVIGGGPGGGDRPPGSGIGTPGRRRLVGALAVVVLLGSGAVLASRSEGGSRPPAAAPTPSPTPPPPTIGSTLPQVLDLAVGRTAAYALVGRCLQAAVLLCGMELLRSDGGPWVPTRARLPGSADPDGFSARLLLSGDRVLVLEDDAELAYLIDDAGYDRRPVPTGRPIGQVPPGAVLESTDGVLTVLDPATIQRRPLAEQPPVGRIRSVASGPPGPAAHIAVGETGSTVVAAVSPDGRRWTAAPVPGLLGGATVLRLAADQAGGAYLVVGRDRRPDLLNEFTELWRLAGGRWTDVTPPTRPASALSAVVGSGGLLVTEETGGVWRLQRDGTMQRLPGPTLGGTPVTIDYLVGGPPGLLVGAQRADEGRTVLVTSGDGGDTWAAEALN